MPKGKIKEREPDHGGGITVDFQADRRLAVFQRFVRNRQREFMREGLDVEYE